ncbi:MAG: hypothetical protein QM770_09280 [Tepidisphaeraceae bacterium]
MGLYEARGTLNKGLKDLMLKWQYAKGYWDDAQSKQVEDELLHKLEQDLRSAVEAIDSMTQLTSSARRECQPNM